MSEIETIGPYSRCWDCKCYLPKDRQTRCERCAARWKLLTQTIQFSICGLGNPHHAEPPGFHEDQP